MRDYKIKNDEPGFLDLPHARQQGVNVRQVNLAFGLGARQQQVHQRVVRQIEQAGQRVDVFIAQDGLVRIEKTRQDQVVFEQSPATAPA
jgi:flagellar hook protein FlgE